MAILEGGVRFPLDPLILKTLRFHGLCPDQLPPNFYRVESSISRLNDLYGLHLNYHDINFMYSLCDNQRSGYYIKVMDTMVRLILCLPDSNRNLARECWKIWFCISYKTHSGSNKSGSISFIIDNMHYINFRI